MEPVPGTSLLVHDAYLAAQALQTRYAEAWCLPASEVAELKQELLVAQGLHGTRILRLPEDLQRTAYLASVGVTPKKSEQEKNRTCRLRSDSESAPRRHRHPLWLRRRPHLPALHLHAGAGQRRLALTSIPRHRQRPRMLECGSTSPLLRQQRTSHPACLSRRPLLLALHLPPGGYGSRPR